MWVQLGDRLAQRSRREEERIHGLCWRYLHRHPRKVKLAVVGGSTLMPVGPNLAMRLFTQRSQFDRLPADRKQPQTQHLVSLTLGPVQVA